MNMTTISERYSKGGLGKYFTKEDVAVNLTKRLFEFLSSRHLLNSFDVVIEPSAGTGAFLTPMAGFEKQIWAFDIDPAPLMSRKRTSLNSKPPPALCILETHLSDMLLISR
ncbi:hypothetical protein ACS3QZ_19640 (plasmid) [Shimia sp. W99]